MSASVSYMKEALNALTLRAFYYLCGVFSNESARKWIILGQFGSRRTAFEILPSITAKLSF